MRHWSPLILMIVATVYMYSGCAVEVGNEESPSEVAVTAEGLTRKIYTYINSNNNAHLVQAGDPIQHRGIRAFAMSQHAENSHNYWTCRYDASQTFQATCTHSPLAGSGARFIYAGCPAGNSCSLYVTYFPNPVNQFVHSSADLARDRVGTMTWLSTQVDTYFDFFDGSTGQAGIYQDVFWRDFP